jgi:amino acid transporter
MDATHKITDRDRDLKRVVGPVGLAANVVNIVIGAGIFVLPAAVAREAGSAAPLAYVACAVIMGGVALCFADAGSRVPTSGGPYGYAETAFGPCAGFFMGGLIWLSAVLAAAGIGSALVDTLANFFPSLRDPVARACLIIVLFAVLALVNMRGAAPGARLVDFLTAAKLIPLCVFLVAGSVLVVPANLPLAAPPSTQGFGRAMMLAIFAFSGMETALGVSGEVRMPSRSVPIGLLAAMATVTLFYIAIQLVAQGALGGALSNSPAPLADALAPLSRGLSLLLTAGAAVSMVGWLAGDVFSAPRVIYAAARDGFLPAWLGLVGARSHAPVAAILVHVLMAALLALTGTFVELAILSTLATVGIYILGCASAMVLKKRGIAIAGTPIDLKGTGFAAVVGIGGMIWVAAQATLREILGIAVALLMIGALYLLARHLRSPSPR